MTATTPSMRAVRFETGLIELELSNRIQCKATPTGSSYLKLFGKCQVDLNLALGQIVKHQVFSYFFFSPSLHLHCSIHVHLISMIITPFYLPFVLGLWGGGVWFSSGGIFPNSDWLAQCSAGGDQRMLGQRGCAYHTQPANSICPTSGIWQR